MLDKTTSDYFKSEIQNIIYFIFIEIQNLESCKYNNKQCQLSPGMHSIIHYFCACKNID